MTCLVVVCAVITQRRKMILIVNQSGQQKVATAAVTCVTFMLRHWTIRFCLVIMEVKRRGRAVKVIQIFVVQIRTTSSPGQVSLI